MSVRTGLVLNERVLLDWDSVSHESGINTMVEGKLRPDADAKVKLKLSFVSLVQRG